MFLAFPRLENHAVCGKLPAKFPPVQQNEDYVLRVLIDVGLVSHQQIDSARSRLNGQPGVIDVLINDGIVSDADVSRTLAGQA